MRDYREQFDGALLKSDVLEIGDLHIGDKLSGTIRNVVDFGAFVDIGLHEDGLVHITRMAKRRVSHPSEIVSVGDIVTVYVYDIDLARERVQLSLLPIAELEARNQSRNEFKSRKKAHNKPAKPEKKKIDMDDAMSRLLAMYGNKHKKQSR